MKSFIFKLKFFIGLEIILLFWWFFHWGKSIWSKDGLLGLVLFSVAVSAFAIIWVKRGKIIDKLIKEIKQRNSPELKEKIPQLEAKKGIIASIFYLIKKMELGKESVPPAANVQELADLGSSWIKKHLGEMMHRLEKIMPLFINSFLPSIKAAIYSSVKKGEVFVGASIGCGIGLFEQKIARWCNKNKFPSVILAVDPNKTLLLKSQKIMDKKKIQTAFWDKKEEINLERLVRRVKNQQRSLVCFVPVSAEKFTEVLPSNKKLSLVWFLNSREHTIEDKPGIFEKIKKYTKNWAILELLRDWRAIFLGNILSWWYSPIFATETEISVSRNLTFKEWVKRSAGRNVVVIKRSFTAWIVSKEFYQTIKESPFGKKIWNIAVPAKIVRLFQKITSS